MPLRKILVLLFVLISYQMPAQIIWGLKGGANVSTLSTSNQIKPRLGYHIGTFYSQHTEEQYGWQVGLQYSLQGARDASTVNGRLAYHYLSMPLLMKFYFAGPTYVEVGPQVAYLLSAKYSETGFKEDQTDVVKRWDFLALLGFGHETDAGGNMGLRFGIGVTNTNGGSVGTGTVFRNILLQGYIAFKIKEFNQ